MSKEILWLDNDPNWTTSYATAMKEQGYNITVVSDVTEAESLINSKRFDLVIIDVMIPTKSEEEELVYTPDLTKSGTETGLVFYQRMKQQLEAKATKALVMTVRLDEKIRTAFAKAGLPSECFTTRLALREVPLFLDKVENILGG